MTRFAIAGLALLLTFGSNARADVLFSNLGDTGLGGFSVDPSLDGPLAQSFTADGWSLFDVQLVLSANDDGGSIIVSIAPDASGSPGALTTLTTLSDSDIFAAGGGGFSTFNIGAFSAPSMVAGNSYWIELTDGGGVTPTSVSWSFGTYDYNVDTLAASVQFDGTADTTTGQGVAFQMQVSDAPEPLSISVLGIGLIGLAAARRRLSRRTNAA